MVSARPIQSAEATPLRKDIKACFPREVLWDVLVIFTLVHLQELGNGTVDQVFDILIQGLLLKSSTSTVDLVIRSTYHASTRLPFRLPAKIMECADNFK
jgi:hypothetical protein